MGAGPGAPVVRDGVTHGSLQEGGGVLLGPCAAPAGGLLVEVGAHGLALVGARRRGPLLDLLGVVEGSVEELVRLLLQSALLALPALLLRVLGRLLVGARRLALPLVLGRLVLVVRLVLLRVLARHLLGPLAPEPLVLAAHGRVRRQLPLGTPPRLGKGVRLLGLARLGVEFVLLYVLVERSRVFFVV